MISPTLIAYLTLHVEHAEKVRLGLDVPYHHFGISDELVEGLSAEQTTELLAIFARSWCDLADTLAFERPSFNVKEYLREWALDVARSEVELAP